MSGLSVRAISDIERGVTQPRRGSAALLGAVLGLTIPEQRATPAGDGADSGSAVPRQLPPAVRATGDLAAQAGSLKNLGYTDLRRGDYLRAADRLRSALTLYQEVGDGCGLVQARDQYHDALAIARQIGAQHTQARAYDCLACT
jgi:hypothetical protein